jgi:hypothetical protein
MIVIDRFDLGHIVAIASNCSLFGLSHLGDYCASKFAIIGMMKNIFRLILIIVFKLGYMECVEDEIFRSKCSGVNTTSKLNRSFDEKYDLFIVVAILGPLKGGLNKRVTEIVM